MESKNGGGLVAVMQSMSGKIVFVLINAATGITTARALHPAGRGELAALGVWSNFLGSLMTLGLPSAFIYWSRREPERRASLLWVSLPLTIALGGLAMVVGIIGIPFWLARYSPHIVHAAQWFMLNAFVVLMIANARAACEAESDFLASSVALCMSPLLALFGLLGLAAFHRMTPVSAAAAYVLSGVPACIFLLSRLRKYLYGRPSHLVSSARMLLGYGIRSYGVDICGTLSVYADQAIVVRLLDPEAMGTYVVALSLSRTLGVIHQAVASVLFPRAVSLAARGIGGVDRACRSCQHSMHDDMRGGSGDIWTGSPLAFVWSRIQECHCHPEHPDSRDDRDRFYPGTYARIYGIRSTRLRYIPAVEWIGSLYSVVGGVSAPLGRTGSELCSFDCGSDPICFCLGKLPARFEAARSRFPAEDVGVRHAGCALSGTDCGVCAIASRQE